MLKHRTCFLRACAVSLLVCFLFSLCRTARIRQSISEQVLRLHILAHSDSEADQTAKLLVRDAILEKTKPLFENAKGRDEAAAAAQNALPDILRIARETLRENGFSEDVSGTVGEARFPAREYDGGTLPAGDYTALRLIIGEGRGHNWWCVLFPPLCTGAATAHLDDVLNAEEQDMVKSPKRYEMRLWLIDRLFGNTPK